MMWVTRVAEVLGALELARFAASAIVASRRPFFDIFLMLTGPDTDPREFRQFLATVVLVCGGAAVWLLGLAMRP